MSGAAAPSLAQIMRRIAELLQSLEKLGNPTARVMAQELVQTLLAFHGVGLARLIELLGLQPDGKELISIWAQDEVIASLLVLHGLHPVDLETRVRKALDQVRPVLLAHGAEAELVTVAEKLVRVRMLKSGSLSGEALAQVLEEAFVAAAPDVQSVEVENAGPRQAERPCRISLPLIS